MTNAEAIRTMSNAEMANEIAEIINEALCQVVPRRKIVISDNERIAGIRYIIGSWLNREREHINKEV